MTRHRRMFYVAPLAIDPRHRHLESAAARNKVLGVATAIRAGGAIPIIVTSTGTQHTSILHPLHIHRKNGMCFVEVFSIGGGLARRLSSMIFLLWFAHHMIRKTDRVLLYNSYPDLLLLAAWQRLRGSPCILDLEDAPRPDDTGSLGRLTNIIFPWLRGLCARPMVVASAKLADQIGVKTFLPVYGVSSFFSSRPAMPFSGGTIRIIFGGTILHDTGADLFAAALRLLASRRLAAPLHLYVTGRFEPGLFDGLKHDIGPNQDLALTVVQDLDTERYSALVSTMDVGLCLKLPSSHMGQTTFPSKVIEIAALGMLLVTTRVSDVPLIFDDESAVLLDGEDPVELADALAGIAADPARARQCAAIGQARIKERFSAEHVGVKLVAFLERAGADA